MAVRDSFMIRVDSAACSVLNAVRRLGNFFDFQGKRYMKKNKELQLPKQDDGSQPFCFVLGNGPSLDADVVNQISQYPTVTVNFFHKGNYDFHSTYHLFIDPVFGDAVGDPETVAYTHTLVAQEKETKFIFSMKAGQPYLKKESEIPENVYFVKCNYSQHDDWIQPDMTMPMTMGPNVLPAAIQCAISMGYKQIYLLGCEFGLYGMVGRGHHYHRLDESKLVAHSNNCLEGLIRCGLVHAHHNAIAKYCAKNGIVIQNLTPRTNLGEYPLNTLQNVLQSINAK